MKRYLIYFAFFFLFALSVNALSFLTSVRNEDFKLTNKHKIFNFYKGVNAEYKNVNLKIFYAGNTSEKIKLRIKNKNIEYNAFVYGLFNYAIIIYHYDKIYLLGLEYS